MNSMPTADPSTCSGIPGTVKMTENIIIEAMIAITVSSTTIEPAALTIERFLATQEPQTIIVPIPKDKVKKEWPRASRTAAESNSEKLAKIGYSTSTDLADFLVKDLCIPFREAYLSVKKIIDLSIAKKTPVQDLEISELKKIEPKITKAVYDYIDVAKSIRSKKSFGGTSPQLSLIHI